MGPMLCDTARWPLQLWLPTTCMAYTFLDTHTFVALCSYFSPHVSWYCAEPGVISKNCNFLTGWALLGLTASIW